jgi:hypothetical protein
VIENVESSYSPNRGIWAQTNKLVVSGGSYHHNNADGIDLDSSSSHCTIHNVTVRTGKRPIFALLSDEKRLLAFAQAGSEQGHGQQA